MCLAMAINNSETNLYFNKTNNYNIDDTYIIEFNCILPSDESVKREIFLNANPLISIPYHIIIK